MSRSIDDRVRVLTRDLGLDARQQAELQTLLVGQREALLKLRADTRLSGADRITAMRAIYAGTADRIRAMLNDEQRKKYPLANVPRQQTSASEADVERWMHHNQPAAAQGAQPQQ